MTPRERVIKTVKFQKPDRVPFDLPAEYGSDFLYVEADPDPNWTPSVKSKLRWEDEFGCIWEKTSIGDKTMGQVKVHPLTDYSMLENFKFPDYKKNGKVCNCKDAHFSKQRREICPCEYSFQSYTPP